MYVCVYVRMFTHHILLFTIPCRTFMCRHIMLTVCLFKLSDVNLHYGIKVLRKFCYKMTTDIWALDHAAKTGG